MAIRTAGFSKNNGKLPETLIKLASIFTEIIDTADYNASPANNRSQKENESTGDHNDLE